MIKKIFAAIVGMCILALQLTGCGNDIEQIRGLSMSEQTTTTAAQTSDDGTQSTAEAYESLADETMTTTEKTYAIITSQSTTTTSQSTKASSQKTNAPSATSAKLSAATTTAAPKTTTKPTTTMSKGDVTTKAPAVSSPNVNYYKNKLVVVGDSIAYGFCAYGYIPYNHNVAKGSMAMRNYTDTSLFMFDPTGVSLSCMNAIKALKPELLYVSMGMNDVNIISPQTYANYYVNFIKEVRSKVPDCIIVAANITPIATSSRFTDISKIRNCNASMQNAVKALNDPNVILFDAYSVVSAGGIYMASGYSAGDGIHLAGSVYQKLLDRLAVTLDQYGVKEKIT